MESGDLCLSEHNSITTWLYKSFHTICLNVNISLSSTSLSNYHASGCLCVFRADKIYHFLSILFISTFVFPVSSLTCPSDCVCVNSTDSLTKPTVNCSSLGLLLPPKIEFSTTRQLVNNQLLYLDFSMNNMTTARVNWLHERNQTFNYSQSLIVNKLLYKHNFITNIMNGDFLVFKEIHYLDLSYNRIETLNIESFNGLVDLKSLTLQHNKIQRINNSTFLDLKNLEFLDFSYNNLKSLENLQGLTSLKYLFLSHNHISTLSEKISLPSLLTITFSYNRIHTLDNNIFDNSIHLMKMDFSNNLISNINKTYFRQFGQLKSLNLNSNMIRQVNNWGLPPFLTSLYLSNMPVLSALSSDAFLGVDKLTYLNISNNPSLGFLQPNIFNSQVKLDILDITNSNLTHISPLTFFTIPETATVLLKDNPLSCSCLNGWIQVEAKKNTTMFKDSSAINCINNSGVPESILKSNISCGRIYIENTTSDVSVKLGSQLLLQCKYNEEEDGVLSWRTPTGKTLYLHKFHRNSSQHLLSQEDVQLNSPYHSSHYWHNSSSYYSELSTLSDRIVILSDGSLYIDYMLRTDTGNYRCLVRNIHHNHSITVQVIFHYNLSGDIKIFAIIVGILCALGFFALNVVYVIISWIARRLINKRRRETIIQMLETLNVYKSTQITRIHENYTHQLKRVRNQYHIQRDRLQKNYTGQVARVKRGCSNQVERIRENYNSKLTHLRDYSSNQIFQIRERTNNQIARIRDYGSTQLEKLRETYKLQHQHVVKLLETLNLDNCRHMVETECMRAESMMFEIDLFAPEEERTESPMTSTESEYSTASGSPNVLNEDIDISKQAENDNIEIEMNTRLRVNRQVELEAREKWNFNKRKSDFEEDCEYYMNVNYRGRHQQFSLLDETTCSQELHIDKDTIPQFQDTICALDPSNKSDNDSVGQELFVTPDNSPTKILTLNRRSTRRESRTDSYVTSCLNPNEVFSISETDRKDYDIENSISI